MTTTIQFITDPRPDEDPLTQVESVLAAGVRWVQLRFKELDTRQRVAVGQPLRELCRDYDATCIVNDDIEAARLLQADGVHLGLDDPSPATARTILGPEAIIGGTCNTFDDIRRRYQEGVDYIGLGPFATTTTKKKLSPTLGLSGYRRLTASCRQAGINIPVVAIGGIRTEDIGPLLAAGIHGIAISSLIIDSSNRQQTIRTILETSS